MRRVITAGLVALTLAGGVSAQDYFQFQRRFQRPPKFATDESFDGSFNFCRLYYTSVRSEYGGQGWWTDYPDADYQLHDSPRGADQDARQPGSRRHAESPRRRAPTRPSSSAVRSSPSRTPGTASFTAARGRGPARVSAQGRVPVVGRLLGDGGAGELRGRDRARAARNGTTRSSTSRPTTRSSG